MAGLFMKIIAGEIPSYKIHEDDETYAFLARDQVAPGHTLVIPKVEVDYFADVPEPYYSAVFRNAKVIAKAIQEATGCARVGTAVVGFEVPHFHYHLIPMEGIADLDFSKGKVLPDEEMERLRGAIVGALES